MTGTAVTRGRGFPFLAYLFGALGELMFGFDTGVIGVAMLFISKDLTLSATQQGIVVSSLLAGAAVGVGVSGALADRYGRRPLMIVMAAVFTLGGLAGAVAPTYGLLVAARAVMGLGVGASAVVVMVYLSEVAPAAHRGRIASLGQLMVVTGTLLAYVVDYLLSPAGAWRWMIGISVVPSVILLVGLLFLPESPRWLAQHGRREQALRVLARLGRGATATAELAEIVSEARAVTESWGRRVARMLAPRFRRTLFACLGLAALVQFLGVNTIIYYAPTTLTTVGFGESGAIAANLGVGALNVVVTIVALGLMDRFGRRRLLLVGSLGMTAAMGFLALVGAVAGIGTGASAWLTLLGMLVFLASFAMSWGMCVRVVISELLPTDIRGSAMGLVLVFNWAANFVVSLLFPIMLAHLGGAATFGIFTGVGVLSVLFVLTLVPETRGRTLEQIQRDLRQVPEGSPADAR